MANPHRGEGELKVGEVTYRLRFTWNAAAEYEDVTGWSLSEALEKVARGKLSAKSIRAMLWAGLREHHPEKTIRDAGDMLDVVGRPEAQRVLGAALRYFFPELAAPADPPDPPKPAPSV